MKKNEKRHVNLWIEKKSEKSEKHFKERRQQSSPGIIYNIAALHIFFKIIVWPSFMEPWCFFTNPTINAINKQINQTCMEFD